MMFFPDIEESIYAIFYKFIGLDINFSHKWTLQVIYGTKFLLRLLQDISIDPMSWEYDDSIWIFHFI